MAQAEGAMRGKQAEKSNRTKQRILDAAKGLIDGGGFSAASSTRIARSAGVSWGVVQHHFGSKQGILVALLEQCTDAYLAFMSASPMPKGSRSARIRAYVKRCWEFYCSPEYRIALEIALAMRFQNTELGNSESFRALQDSNIELWRSTFQDSTASDEVLAHINRHNYVVLSGLVVDGMLESEASNIEMQLQMLGVTLEMYLYGTHSRDPIQ